MQGRAAFDGSGRCTVQGPSQAAADHRRAGSPGDGFGVSQMVRRRMGNEDEIDALQFMGFDRRTRIFVEKGIEQDVLSFVGDDFVGCDAEET